MRVNSISPTYTRTQLVNNFIQEPIGAEKYPTWMERTPMGAMAEVGDLVGAVVAGGRCDRLGRGGGRRAGTAQVKAHFVDRVKRRLHVVGAAALEHDVARLAVEGDQAGAVLLPDVAELAQGICVVVHARRRHHAQGVEFLGLREGLTDFREAGDDAAAVTEDADDAAVFPMGDPVLVRQFKLT